VGGSNVTLTQDYTGSGDPISLSGTKVIHGQNYKITNSGGRVFTVANSATVTFIDIKFENSKASHNLVRCNLIIKK
jgi:hypothetical protein